MKYFKIKEHPNLYRDSETNIIVNNNIKDYNEYISRKKAKSKKMEELESDIKNLKDDISEIKGLLKSLVNEWLKNKFVKYIINFILNNKKFIWIWFQ